MTAKTTIDTLTRSDLAEAVTREFRVSKLQASEIVETVLEEIGAALARGESVKIAGFGTFSVRAKRQRLGRNPKTGETAVITPRRVLSFRPSNILKAAVNTTRARRSHG